MNEEGYVQIYTGNGKGKTTAAFGLAIRAAGRKKKSYIAQFMKKGEYGEVLAVEKYLSEWITVEQFGLPEFHHSGSKVSPEEVKAAKEGIDTVRKVLKEQKYDIVIMDEINVTLHFDIIDTQEVLDLIGEKPIQTELVLTGRYAPFEIMAIADLVTEMKEIKHYFAEGVKARQGTEK